MDTKTEEVIFHYCDLRFRAYKNGPANNSEEVIKEAIRLLQEDSKKGIYHPFDRKENTGGDEERVLILLGINPKPYRTFARLALVKKKAPFLMSKDYVIEDIENASNKDFVEVTNFIIDTSRNVPLMMVEFNNDGPRISDIEYYLRHITLQYKLAYACTTIMHVKGDIKEIMKNLKNVFHIDLKVRADKSVYYKEIDSTYFSSIMALKKEFPYKEIKLALGFNVKKKKSGDYPINVGGIKLARKIFDYMDKNTKNQENIEDLKIRFDKGDGPEVMDFIKNKEVSKLQINLSSKDRPDVKDLKEKAGTELNLYLKKFVS